MTTARLHSNAPLTPTLLALKSQASAVVIHGASPDLPCPTQPLRLSPLGALTVVTLQCQQAPALGLWACCPSCPPTPPDICSFSSGSYSSAIFSVVPSLLITFFKSTILASNTIPPPLSWFVVLHCSYPFDLLSFCVFIFCFLQDNATSTKASVSFCSPHCCLPTG